MDTMTISQVSKSYGISTRTLRYYEQIGLIESFRRDDYSYRIYNETALTRLRQILILRKLRIPLKQIKVILEKPDAVTAIEVFRQNINELNTEITALSTIRDILLRFVEELQITANIQIHSLITRDGIIESISFKNINFKEEKTMENLNKSEESISRLKDVRIIYLPPATVVSAHFIGDDPESRTYQMVDQYMRDTGLYKIKPDLRHYGFNHPNHEENGAHGYEVGLPFRMIGKSRNHSKRSTSLGRPLCSPYDRMGNFNEWNGSSIG
jgi:DNA-binding transcriptional MerR regulator